MNRYCTVCCKTTNHIEGTTTCQCEKCGTVKPYNVNKPVLGMYVKVTPRFN
jgi:hypothetical protein